MLVCFSTFDGLRRFEGFFVVTVMLVASLTGLFGYPFCCTDCLDLLMLFDLFVLVLDFIWLLIGGLVGD